MTWTSDDRQFSSFSDGYGLQGSTALYNTRALWIHDDATTAFLEECKGYPSLPLNGSLARYYGFGALAVDNCLYHVLCSSERPSDAGNWAWNGAKIIFSSDNGNTWRNQDGSTPVAWESYEDQSSNNMLFLREPEGAFCLVSLLQMGRNYTDNRDGYVYGYGTNGHTDGTMNELVMFRTPKNSVLDRTSYEFFSGLAPGGNAKWKKDIRGRVVVHTFPRGWVNTLRGRNQNVLQSWVPSVVYNAPLGLYMMASSGVGCTDEGEWFEKSKPSYLGLWVASEPWGPWTQIHEEMAWQPGDDTEARCYSPQISSKWIAKDGKSFWLAWSDFKRPQDSFARIMDTMQSISDQNERIRFFKQSFPHYLFNMQRIDLALT